MPRGRPAMPGRGRAAAAFIVDPVDGADGLGWRTSRYDGDRQSALESALARKGAHRISVVIPALNEERTVGAVTAGVAGLVERGLVDEVLVVDGGSGDATGQVARSAGARVVPLADLMSVDPHPGKGGALWASLQVTSGDLLLFLDADVAPFDWGWVPAMLTPLLLDGEVELVKGCYERPVGRPGGAGAGRGGRVTELVARPLLALLWPELGRLRQPLAGETAARRPLLERLPFAIGYGVEIGLLIDTYQSAGLRAIAEVDLGIRWHAPQEDEALARMAAVVLHAALRRLPAGGSFPDRLTDTQLWQYLGGGGNAGVGSPYDVPHDDLLPRWPPATTGS